jgi:hypothetical protein
MYASNEIMILSRNAGAGAAQGALYAHACPACGGPVGDTLDLKCGYCGELLNSTQREWIVSDLMAAEKYQALAASHKPAMTTHVALKQLDPLFAARDYAFNNVMMIIGSGGAITMDELAFAQQLSRRMGYDLNSSAACSIWRKAANSRYLPTDRKGCEVLKLMEKAALADPVQPEAPCPTECGGASSHGGLIGRRRPAGHAKSQPWQHPNPSPLAIIARPFLRNITMSKRCGQSALPSAAQRMPLGTAVRRRRNWSTGRRAPRRVQHRHGAAGKDRCRGPFTMTAARQRAPAAGSTAKPGPGSSNAPCSPASAASSN